MEYTYGERSNLNPDLNAETTSQGTTVTRYGLGARGVDLIERTAQGGAVTTGFPIYDAHGNNVATLSRASNGGYAVNDRRSYDAWGVVRAQQSGGDPKLRYCASLGHKQDDESGLIYMRARYYEPTSGRFVSEDPSMDGSNWLVYCGNNPVCFSDSSGRYKVTDVMQYSVAFTVGFTLLCLAVFAGKSPMARLGLIIGSANFFATALGDATDKKNGAMMEKTVWWTDALIIAAGAIAANLELTDKAKSGLLKATIFLVTMESVMCLGALLGIDGDPYERAG